MKTNLKIHPLISEMFANCRQICSKWGFGSSVFLPPIYPPLYHCRPMAYVYRSSRCAARGKGVVLIQTPRIKLLQWKTLFLLIYMTYKYIVVGPSTESHHNRMAKGKSVGRKILGAGDHRKFHAESTSIMCLCIKQL